MEERAIGGNHCVPLAGAYILVTHYVEFKGGALPLYSLGVSFQFPPVKLVRIKKRYPAIRPA